MAGFKFQVDVSNLHQTYIFGWPLELNEEKKMEFLKSEHSATR